LKSSFFKGAVINSSNRNSLNNGINFDNIRNQLNHSEVLLDFNSFHKINSLDPDYTISTSLFEVHNSFKEPKLSFLNNWSKSDNLQSAFQNILLDSILTNTESLQSIYFSPSGPLNNISFSSLKNKEGKYLCELFDLYQLSAVSKLAERRDEPKKKSFLFYGGINYNTSKENRSNDKELNQSFNLLSSLDRSVKGTKSRGESWTYLPATLEEINQISLLLKKKNIQYSIKTKLDASEEGLRKLDGKSPSVIHLATHGYFF
jgi:CHAT domain-containing protein